MSIFKKELLEIINSLPDDTQFDVHSEENYRIGVIQYRKGGKILEGWIDTGDEYGEGQELKHDLGELERIKPYKLVPSDPFGLK